LTLEGGKWPTSQRGRFTGYATG